MKILIVHEVDYLNKVIFEFQIIPEIFSLLNHEVFIIDYPQGETTETYNIDFNLGCGIFENIHRVYNTASVTVMRPFCLRSSIFKRLSYFLRIGRLIDRVIRHKKIDLILLYSVPNNGWQTIRLSHKYKIPIVFRVIDISHQIVPGRIYKYPTLLIEKYVYKNSDLVLTLTPKLKDYVIKSGADPRNVKVQLPGVDTKKFRPQLKNFDLAQRWNLNEGSKIVLFMGTLYRFSTLDWLAQRWNLILKDIPEAKMLIVGNGALFNKLKDIIHKNNMEESIILTDWQPYELLPDFINLSDICINLFGINSITRDIIPTKLFQYLSCAKPVVAFPLPGTMEILRGEQDGIVYAKDNNDALNIIIDLLKNRTKIQRIGENGYRLVKERYDWEKIANDILVSVKPLIRNHISLR